MSRPQESAVSAQELLEGLNVFMAETQRLTRLQIAIAGAARFVSPNSIRAFESTLSQVVEGNMQAIGAVVMSVERQLGKPVQVSHPGGEGHLGGIAFDPNMHYYKLAVEPAPGEMQMLAYDSGFQLYLGQQALGVEMSDESSPYA